MSIGALELQSLFRKYSGEIADLDLDEAESNRRYNYLRRGLEETRLKDRKRISENAASRGMTHSGTHLEQQTDLERAYDRSSAEADAQQQANLTRIAKKRLDAKGAYDEGVALSKMSSLLEKQQGAF